MFHQIALLVRHWDHKITGGVGLGIVLSPTLDVLTRLLGLVAVAVSIYCSISKNRREQAAFLKDNPKSKDHPK